MRKRIFEIIEVSRSGDSSSMIYDGVMLCAIIVSLMPLAFKVEPAFFEKTDVITTVLFIADYLLRYWTSDLKLKKGLASYLIYPFTPWAIVDLISILPTITVLNSGFRLFRVFRIFKTFRVFRIFKAMRYSRSFRIILGVVRNSKEALMAVLTLSVGYIMISALIIFNVEPDTFNTYFDAIYWATVSLTTVGYGDIYPVSTVGKIIAMISALFGIAIVALPAGIITAGYMSAIKEENEERSDVRDDYL